MGTQMETETGGKRGNKRHERKEELGKRREIHGNEQQMKMRFETDEEGDEGVSGKKSCCFSFNSREIGKHRNTKGNEETGKRREEDVERKEQRRRLTRQRERTTIDDSDERISSVLLSVSCLFSSCCLPFSPVSFLSASCRAVSSVPPFPAVGQQDKRTHRNRSFASLITLSSLDQEISIGESPVAEHSSSTASFLFIDSDFIRVRKRAGSGSSDRKGVTIASRQRTGRRERERKERT